MSEETKVVEPQTQQTETQTETTQTPEVEKAKEMVFTQQQLDNIIKSRLDAEKNKYEKKLQEEEKQRQEILKQKQLEEAKTKQDLEKIMQERIAEKDSEINRYKTEIKKERIDNNILSVASQNKAISPSQVVALMKDKVRLTDDNRVEILDNNSNVRYNPKGELLTIEESVKEFIIQDLDLSKPEDRSKYAEYRKKRDAGAIEINLNNK